MTAHSKKRCIELIRVSTAGQAGADRASIPAQHEINRRTAEHHGLEIVRTIEIADVSGANVLRSPEMQELLRLIENPGIVGVVAREFSRLMRPDNYDDLSLLQRFVDSHTDIYLPDGRVDPSDLLMTMVRAGVAGKERKEMLERAWGAKEEKRRRGELAQSTIVLPWGVDYKEGVWSYKALESERVRAAFKKILAGDINYNSIAADLGVSHRGAALILRNPIWKGWRILDKKRDPSSNGKYASKNGRQSDRRKIQRAPEDVIRVRVIEPPLISEANWERAQAIMERKAMLHWRDRRKRGVNPPRFTYAGFLRCAECGGPVHSVLAKHDYYVCKAARLKPGSCETRYMPREQLETRLDLLFAEKFTSTKYIQKCLESLRRQRAASANEGRVERLKAERVRLIAKRARILDAFLDGAMMRDERDERQAKVSADLANVERALEDAGAPQQSALTPKELRAQLVHLFEWRRWSYDQKRRVLATLAPEIRVADGKVRSVRFNLYSVIGTRRGRGSSRPRA